MSTDTRIAPLTARLAFALLCFSLLGTLLPASLSACPTKEKLLEHMLHAHGGLEKWAAAPTVSWQDEFKQGEAPTGLVSRVTVEQGPRRAYIDYPGTEMSLAWDGTKAWSRNWMLPYPPRFMALLNFHFLNLPWLAADPGVILSEFGTRTLPAHLPDALSGNGIEYFSVKITYEPGTGDTPRDYYRLYVHPESHELHAVEYTVTYSSLLPEGMSETPANTLVFAGFTDVDGLKVPTGYTIYRPDGAVFGSAEARDWSFEKPFDESRMTPAEDATVDTSTP